MPDRSAAAKEHAITQDLSALPPTQIREHVEPVLEAEFAVVRRGYDRDAVDAYVMRARQIVAELQATRTPDSAVRRALERVGEEVSGILRRAHETAGEITAQSRSDADERLQRAMREAHEITATAKAQLRDLDADADRIWAERQRIIEDARALAEDLLSLADTAAERFAPDEETEAGDAEAQDAAPSRPGELLQDREQEDGLGEPDDAAAEEESREGGLDFESAPDLDAGPELDEEPRVRVLRPASREAREGESPEGADRPGA
jgi:cell division septum initiation protein DivIVA